ncbi:biorientation of chromosomes in cell division protein 1-like 1 isoform X2 [Drosophila busckii]|uniref:biorientation of chromosomes in cell division protein 1-like 1 isoform X2 n=1 Tax=Drosophila busckii TaxID=30019 RepID=UPI00083EE5E4|nr:biorientation of chromosomes in cell division protein 1-like 1 isoform X2 [Drosophila busckii]
MDQFVKTLIEEVKSQGVFDEFRFNCCLADVDTKPAYQNVRNRVETAVNDFLAKQQWTPETNKVQLRERLRKHLLDSDVLDKGVDHIVDQVVNPKVATIFEPKIESIAYKYLGIPPPPPPANPPPPRPPLLPAPPLPPYPGHTLGHLNGGNLLNIETAACLLPTDLEQISPDSDRATVKSDLKEDSKEGELPPPGVDDDMDDDVASPTFESATSFKDDINNLSLNTSDSVRDVKELAGESRDAGASQTSQLSQVSSDSHLTIASTETAHATNLNISEELDSSLAANISEEAQMPKFNENPDETESEARPELHFDIKQDAITFQGTERHRSEPQSLSIEDAIMCEVKANICNVDNVEIEAAPVTECVVTAEDEQVVANNFELLLEAAEAAAIAATDVPENKIESDESKPIAEQLLVATELALIAAEPPLVATELPLVATEQPLIVTEPPLVVTEPPLVVTEQQQQLKEELNKSTEFAASPATTSSSFKTTKLDKDKNKERDRDRKHHHHSDSTQRRERDKSHSKNSSSSKHSSSHSSSQTSSSSRHRSSSSKNDKSSSSSSSRSNHDSKRSSSSRHESSSSSSKRHKSSSSTSKSDRSSHSHSHSRHSSSSSSKRSDRDRHKSSSTSSTLSVTVPTSVQDDHNEEKSKLHKRHSNDSNDEGKSPRANNKAITTNGGSATFVSNTSTKENGNVMEANDNNCATETAETATESLPTSHVVNVTDMLMQSSSSFIEISSVQQRTQTESKQEVKPQTATEEEVPKADGESPDRKVLKPEREVPKTGEEAPRTEEEAARAEEETQKTEGKMRETEEKAPKTEEEVLKTGENAPNTEEEAPKTEKETRKTEDEAKTEREAPKAATANQKSASLEPTKENKTPTSIEQTEAENKPMLVKDAKKVESLEERMEESVAVTQPTTETESDCEPKLECESESCTHLEQNLEEFTLRLQLLEQHIKDRRTLLNQLSSADETQSRRRSHSKRRLSSENISSTQQSSSSASSSSSSGNSNTDSPDAKRNRLDTAKTSPTPSELSLNSKENEEVEKEEKVHITIY